MKAVVLYKPGPIETNPLVYTDVEKPIPKKDEILVRVKCCGICRTDLHIIENEIKPVKLPLIPGHQVVGVVEEVGEDVVTVKKGDKVGVPWLYWACSKCKYCRKGLENLCDHALFTGYSVDGGYAEYMVAKDGFVYHIPPGYDECHAAPLLCGGAIGYRALKLTGLLDRGEGKLGLYGFGSSAHMIIQVAVKRGLKVYVFTRSNEKQEQALKLGAAWVGKPIESPPEKLDAAIIFAPAGWIVKEALKNLDKGGRLVLGGIYMTPIERLEYELIWLEKEIKSVANVTRNDVREFLSEAAKIKLKTMIKIYQLKEANKALQDLKHGKIKGSGVLKIS